MKKLTVLLLLLSLFSVSVYADDAVTMPKGWMRIYFIPTFTTIDGEYNSDGDFVKDAGGDTKVTSISSAIEVGVTDWFTAALQWVPGALVSSEIGGSPTAKLNDVSDMMLGAKVQIIGRKAPVKSSSFRIAQALGLKLPISSPDYAEERTKALNGQDFLAASADTHVLGMVSRTYIDFILYRTRATEFFINLYNETILNFGKKKRSETSYEEYSTVLLSPLVNDEDVTFETKMTFEIEPFFTQWVSRSFRLGATTKLAIVKTTDRKTESGIVLTEGGHEMTLAPSLQVLWWNKVLPLELKLRHSFSLAGKNTSRTSATTFILRGYIRF